MARQPDVSQVHQHNLTIYDHPVAAFQQTIESRVSSDGPDLGVSKVLAHALRTGDAIDCDLRVLGYAKDGTLNKTPLIQIKGEMANDPYLSDSHTIMSHITVPDGISVPHDHIVEYTMTSGKHQADGLVPNFFSDIASADDSAIFAPGTRQTLMGDMYDTDRYDEYRNGHLPIANMLVSGISTGKNSTDGFRVGSIDIASSFDLPKDRTTLRVNSVPSYVGENMFDRVEQHESPMPIGSKLINSPYTDLGLDGTKALLNVAVMKLVYDKFNGDTSRATQFLNDPAALGKLLPKNVSDALVLLCKDNEKNVPSLYNLLSNSSSIYISNDRARAAYAAALSAMTSNGEDVGKEDLSKHQDDVVLDLLERSSMTNQPGTRFASTGSSTDTALILCAVRQILRQVKGEKDVDLDIFFIESVQAIFDIQVSMSSGLSHNGKTRLVDMSRPGWMGESSGVVLTKDLGKISSVLIGVKSPVLDWILSIIDSGVPLVSNKRVVTTRAQRCIGTWYRLIHQGSGAVLYFLPLSDGYRISYAYPNAEEDGAGVVSGKSALNDLLRKQNVLFGKDNYGIEDSQFGLRSARGSVEADAAASWENTENQVIGPAASSSTSSYGALPKPTGKASLRTAGAWDIGVRFAPYGHTALTATDVLLARPTRDEHRSANGQRTSISSLVDVPLVGAIIQEGSIHPDVLTLKYTEKNPEDVVAMYKNGSFVGHMIYNPIINQYNTTDGSPDGAIVGSAITSRQGLSWNNNFYAQDLNEVYPERKKMAAIADEMRAETLGAKRSDSSSSIEAQVLAAQNSIASSSSTSDAPTQFPWRNFNDTQEEPSEYKMGSLPHYFDDLDPEAFDEDQIGNRFRVLPVLAGAAAGGLAAGLLGGYGGGYGGYGGYYPHGYYPYYNSYAYPRFWRRRYGNRGSRFRYGGGGRFRRGGRRSGGGGGRRGSRR